MKLDAELIRLPLRFDAAALAAEVEAVDEGEWRPHPEGHPGNSALPLVALRGDPDDNGVRGPMRPTAILDELPLIRALLGALDVPIGRTRLMRLDGDAEATPHVDVNYYWLGHARIHVPIVTTPEVQFIVGERSTHMAPGETWVFDTWKRHNVRNPSESRRIHLVVDTVGSASFWDLVERGERVGDEPLAPSTAPLLALDGDGALQFESVNHSVVMPPAELEQMLDWMRSETGVDASVDRAFTRLQREWRSLWSVHGDTESGHAAFRAALDETTNALRSSDASMMTNGNELRSTFAHAIGVVAAPAADAIAPATSAPTTVVREPLPVTSTRPRRIVRPVFIVSPPRSGSTLLFETLARSPDLWTVGDESHEIIEGIPSLHPSAHDWESNRLGAGDASPAVADALVERFEERLVDRRGNAAPPHLRGLVLLEKTPKNALRIPFLAQAFPDARFIYLYRDPVDTMASMLEGWRSGRFVTYPNLPGWVEQGAEGSSGPRWSFLLVPGWRDLKGLPLRELVARQWATTTGAILDDMQALDPNRWCVAGYGRLVQEPQKEIQRLCRFLGARWDQRLEAPLPPSRYTVTAPDPAKSARNARELQDVLHVVSDVTERARQVFAEPPGRSRQAPRRQPPQPRVAATPASNDPGFSSSHTASFVPLLDQLGVSLAVSTYQSGRLILVRADNGAINTHFRVFESPMGLAVAGRRLVVGTRRSVWEYRNQPAVAPKLEPAGKHDAAFLPLSVHFTGDIRVHDVGIDAEGQVWIVNTAFSCLATLDSEHSFVPRWRPPFTTALAAEDRCHLNGLAMVDGRPKYVTALGTRDTQGGWREEKGFGGVIIDVESNEIVSGHLCMPHSPRWHDGKLWVLESGKGTLATVDLASGELTPVAEMPGFTRGLAFAGPFAFVGLSLVRESLFDGVPIVGRSDLACGVWVVDTRSGALVAFLRFSGTVQELFDVQVLRHRFPEVTESGDPRVSTSFVVPQSALADVAGQQQT